MTELPPYSWETIVQRVRRLREERGVSQEQCATFLGLQERGLYSKRERGVIAFTLEELDALRKWLGAPYGWPFIPSEDAYLVALAHKARELGDEPQEIPPELAAFFSKYPESKPDEGVVQEMLRLARLDSGGWGDQEIWQIKALAEARVLRRRSRAAQRPPELTESSAPSRSHPPKKPPPRGR